jgi:hypothetical protein
MRTATRSLSLVITVSFLALATSASAQLAMNSDCWVTDPGSSTIEVPAIPSGFFGSKNGTPSDPFGPAVLPVFGVPLSPSEFANCGCADYPPMEFIWVDPHGTPVAADDQHAVGQALSPVDLSDTDTCVVRLNDATFVGGVGVPEPVDIQLVELSLVSGAIIITYGIEPPSFYEVFVTEDGPQSQGTITVTPDIVSPPEGSMILDGLPVAYQLSFQEVLGGPGLFNISGLSLTFQGATGIFKPMPPFLPSMSGRALMLLAVALGLGALLFTVMPGRARAS